MLKLGINKNKGVNKMKKIISTLVLSLSILIIGAQISTNLVYADEFTQFKTRNTYGLYNDQPTQVDK